MAFAGYITKEGGTIFKNWKRRWAVLNPVTGTLSYYENEKDLTRPLGIVVVRGSTIAAVPKSEKGKTSCFSITQVTKVFYAQAENEEELTTWIEALTLVSSSVGENLEIEETSNNLYSAWVATLESDKKTWRKRWAILRPTELVLFRDKKERESEFTIPLENSKISFPAKSRFAHNSSSSFSSTAASSTSNGEFSINFLFYIKINNGNEKEKTIHCIIAKTDDELTLWVDQLHLSIARFHSQLKAHLIRSAASLSPSPAPPLPSSRPPRLDSPSARPSSPSLRSSSPSSSYPPLPLNRPPRPSSPSSRPTSPSLRPSSPSSHPPLPTGRPPRPSSPSSYPPLPSSRPPRVNSPSSQFMSSSLQYMSSSSQYMSSSSQYMSTSSQYMSSSSQYMSSSLLQPCSPSSELPPLPANFGEQDEDE